MKKNITLIFISFLFLNSTCNVKTDSIAYNTNFKVGNFFLKQIDSLQKSNSSLYLTTKLNGVASDTNLNVVNWENQLQLFTDLEIENPKYKDSFLCDTLLFINNTALFKYKSISTQSKIKLIEIFIENKKVKTVFAKLKSSNYLYTSTASLYYETGKYFAIEAKDDFLWFSTFNSDLFIKGILK